MIVRVSLVMLAVLAAGCSQECREMIASPPDDAFLSRTSPENLFVPEACRRVGGTPQHVGPQYASDITLEFPGGG